MTYRWGFLGASRIGRGALAPAVLAAGQALHAIAARDLSRARAFADDFAIPIAYGDYASLIADPEIDIVYIALGNDQHLPWILAALAADKHVLCEKPLVLTAAELRSVAQAASRAGRTVMEAFCHLHHPQMRRMHEILAAGTIGEVISISAAFGNTLLRPDDFRWNAAYGGGALYDLGGYCISAMRVLTGREPVSVSAVQTMRGDVDASFHGLLDFGDGLTASFMCSLVSVQTQHCVFIGTSGRIEMDWPYSTRGRTTCIRVNDQVERFEPTNPYITMVRHFVRMAQGEPDLPYGLDWSLAQAGVLDGMFAAARTGAMVRLSA